MENLDCLLVSEATFQDPNLDPNFLSLFMDSDVGGLMFSEDSDSYLSCLSVE